MSGGIKKGKFVYKNQDSLNKMHAFYDKTLASLGVSYSEDYFETSFGQTHCLLVGNKDKPRICTIHGGNGITTLFVAAQRLLHSCAGCYRDAGEERVLQKYQQ